MGLINTYAKLSFSKIGTIMNAPSWGNHDSTENFLSPQWPKKRKKPDLKKKLISIRSFRNIGPIMNAPGWGHHDLRAIFLSPYRSEKLEKTGFPKKKKTRH